MTFQKINHILSDNTHLKIMELKQINNCLDGLQEEAGLPSFYEKQSWKVGESYRMRVSHIFDLSKFYVVFLEEELNLFQNYIHYYYFTNGAHCRIKRTMLHQKLYCVVFTEGSFFRAKIVNIPIFVNGIERVMVYLIDFGQVVPVNFKDVYYLHEKFYRIPCFAVRACLNHIQPYDSNTWSVKAIQRFNELVKEKVLICVLESTDPVNKIINISIADVDHQLQVHDICTILVKEKLALPVTTRRKWWYSNSLIPNIKNPYLFPSFQAIEQGKVPADAKSFNLLIQMNTNLFIVKQVEPNFPLLKCYYNFDQHD